MQGIPRRINTVAETGTCWAGQWEINAETNQQHVRILSPWIPCCEKSTLFLLSNKNIDSLAWQMSVLHLFQKRYDWAAEFWEWNPRSAVQGCLFGALFPSKHLEWNRKSHLRKKNPFVGLSKQTLGGIHFFFFPHFVTMTSFKPSQGSSGWKTELWEWVCTLSEKWIWVLLGS